MENKLQTMSNAELKILLIKMENEYEALKVATQAKLNRMKELDEEFNKVKNVLLKRTKGQIEL